VIISDSLMPTVRGTRHYQAQTLLRVLPLVSARLKSVPVVVCVPSPFHAPFPISFLVLYASDFSPTLLFVFLVNYTVDILFSTIQVSISFPTLLASTACIRWLPRLGL
jgi:hypothetical protein